jgi:hypothetical protein
MPDSNFDATQVRATPLDVTAPTEISGPLNANPLSQLTVAASSPLSVPAMPSAISAFSIQAIDLSAESILRGAPRIQFNGMTVPVLGGIPLLAKLGQGGMGAVYFGVHTRLNLEVAVKVLPFQLADRDPTMIQRFYREAQIAAKVKSRHLVSVMDVNQDAGLFYLVMEFVSGVTAGQYLKNCIREKQPGVNEATALDICIAATEGLVAAHTEGVVHRDIKPENILIPHEKGTGALLYTHAKLADLGLARQDDGAQSLTAAQNTMGTPGFMSPEQANDSKTAGKPADVFSMGATLYALLCGKPPFTGETSLEAILSTIQKPHRPIAQLRRDLCVDTSALTDRCLNKRPERRHIDAAALLAALKECRAQLAGAATIPERGRRATGIIAGVAPARASADIEETLAARQAAPLPAVAKAPSMRPMAVAAQHEHSPVQKRGGAGKLLMLLFGAGLLVCGGLWMGHQREVADQMRREEEASAAQEDRKRHEEELAKTTLPKLPLPRDHHKELDIREKIAKALQAGDKAKSTENPPAITANPSGDNDPERVRVIPRLPILQPPNGERTAPRTQVPEKVQLLRRKFDAANDELQKASSEMRVMAEQVNKLSQVRRTAFEKVNKQQKEAEDARDAARKAKDAAKRAFGGNKQLNEDASRATTAAQDADDAVRKAKDEFDRAEKQYNDLAGTYNNSNAEIGRIREEQLKVQRELVNAERDANRSDGQ